MEIAVLGFVAVAGLFALIWVNIYKKAGYDKWLGLIVLVPVVGFIAMLMFAFGEWPISRGATSAVSSPKCQRCRRQVEHDWRVCPYCKEVLVFTCPKCNKDTARGWEACAYCGEELVSQNVECPSCGESVQMRKDFCNHCGTRLAWKDTGPYIKYPIQCPSCSQQVPSHLKMCPLCGEGLSKKDDTQSTKPSTTKTATSQCPMCGDMIRENWKACPRCGENLSTDE